MTDRTWDRIMRAARQVKGFREDGLNSATGIKDEKAHGMDSIGRVEFTLAIQDEFGIQIGDEELDQLSTLGDLVALLRTKAA